MRYATIDYRGTHPTTKGDFGRLLEFARQLVGEPVLFGAIGYPHELTVHFGAPVEFKGPRGRTLVEGSYVLGAVCSAWQIKSGPQGRTVIDFGADPYSPQYVTNPITEPEVEKFLEQVSGSVVRDVRLAQSGHGYVLSVILSDGSLIEFFPTPDHFEIGVNDPIPTAPPDWELFTPYKRYLRVGPGLQWAYQPSDEAEK